MSNKNLKVYKIQFLTQLKTLHLNVKFPCEIKMIWKRSNQSAQSQRIKLHDGKAIFNETLKLNVNMYFDTTTNKFVEKKCIYSFLIFTQKGQKSAGSVSFDFADFFNKRIYQIQQSFDLQKCPVKDTKVDMKIYYEQSHQGGYDSMSQISTTSQLDVSSNNPLDLSQINETPDKLSQKSSSTVQGSKKQQSKKQIQTKKQQNFDKLNQSDLDLIDLKSTNTIVKQKSQIKSQKNHNLLSDIHSHDIKQNKIGQNIKGIQKVTTKINDFVGKFKQNLNYQLQQKKRKINQLSEQLQSANQINKKLQNQLKQQKNSKQQLSTILVNLKSQKQSQVDDKNKKIQDLQRKLQQQRKNVQKLQKRLNDQNQKGQQQGKYIQQLKDDFKKQQQLLQKQISKLQNQVQQQKSLKNEFQTKYKQSQENHTQLSQKYDRLVSKYQSLQAEMRKRQSQIQQTRINLDKAVQNLIQSLSHMV